MNILIAHNFPNTRFVLSFGNKLFGVEKDKMQLWHLASNLKPRRAHNKSNVHTTSWFHHGNHKVREELLGSEFGPLWFISLESQLIQSHKRRFGEETSRFNFKNLGRRRRTQPQRMFACLQDEGDLGGAGSRRPRSGGATERQR